MHRPRSYPEDARDRDALPRKNKRGVKQPCSHRFAELEIGIFSLNLVRSGEPNQRRIPNRMRELPPQPMPKDWSSSSVLHDTAEQFHILVDSVEEYAIYMLDPNGDITTWNRGAQKIKGYSAEEIIGKNFICFYTAEDVAAGKPQRNLREAVRRGYIRDQGLRVRKDGSTFEAEVIITVLRDEKGKIRGFSKVTRDITDQIRSREFEAEKIAAQKAGKAKDDFLAALSHELRTPLTPALAAATYLQDKADKFSPEFAEDIEIIKRNVQLQARLIDDLLDLTRIV